MLIFFTLAAVAFASVDGSLHSLCVEPYLITKYPFNEIFSFDPSVKSPGLCGEDPEDLSAVWIELKNTDTKNSVTYLIEVNSSIAFHNTCDGECVDALPQLSTLTISPQHSFLIVLKGSDFVSVSITTFKTSSSEAPVSVTAFPYEGEFATTTVSSTCSGETSGVFLEFPDMAKVPVKLSTCGSTAAVQVILHSKDKCIVPEQSICESGNGVIATFEGEPMTIELLTGSEGDFSDGHVNVKLSYEGAPKCEKAAEYKIDENGGVIMRTVYTGIPKNKDGCSDEMFSYDFVHISGIEETTISFTISKSVQYDIHIFEDCEMKECFESYNNSDTSLSFDLDLSKKTYYIKVGINHNENIDYTLHVEEDKDKDGLSVGMKVFIAIFIVVAVITIIAGIAAIVFAVIKTRKTGYSNI